VEFVLQACIAVAEAHSVGIVHRDLKPANLFCIQRPDGQLSIKVIDFGISKSADAVDGGRDSVTKTSTVLGSPIYMAPEQMRSAKGADAQSDIWALGVILYELLSGRVPFHGETAADLAVKVSTYPLPSLRALRPDVPAGLEAVISKCLEKDPRMRHRNVAELATALAGFAPPRARAAVERITGTILKGRRSSAELEAPPSSQLANAFAGASTVVALGSTSGNKRSESRRGSPILVAGVGGVLLAVAVGFVVIRHPGHEGSAPQAPGAASLSASPATATIPVAVTSPSASPAPPPGAPAVQASNVAPSRPAPPPSLGPRSHRASAGSAATSGKPAPASSPSGAPGCDPPYTFDDQGQKHFKPECYLKH
jgi:serine/threonine-protein kinase